MILVQNSRFQFKTFWTEIVTSRYDFSSKNNVCTECAIIISILSEKRNGKFSDWGQLLLGIW